MTSAHKGVALAVVSLFASAGVFLLGREGKLLSDLPTFLFWWYAPALAAWAVHAAFRPEVLPWRFRREARGKIAAFIVWEALAVSTFFYALGFIDAALASFIGQSHLLFMALLGYLMLGERFRPAEGVGGLFIIAGLGLIAWAPGEMTRLGLVLLTASNFAWAVAHVYAKRVTDDAHPFALAHLRCLAMTLATAAWFAALGRWPAPGPWPFLPLLVAGGLVGAYINMGARYAALRHLEVSKIALIAAQHPVAVLLFSVALGKTVPSGMKIAGGVCALFGSYLLIGARLREASAAPPPGSAARD